MLRRIFKFGMVTSIIQISALGLLIFIAYLFRELIIFSHGNDRDDPLTVFSIVFFALIVLIQNLLAALINNLNVTYVLMGVATTVYLFFIIDAMTSIGFESVICIIFGLLVLVSKTEIDARLH